MNFLLTLALVACSFTVVFSSDWTYTPDAAHGPGKWGTVSATCDAHSQSPINIEPDTAVVNGALGSFKKDAFASTPTKMTLLNNGHSIKVALDGGYLLPDRMGGLPGKFQAAQFHFHWGSETGSEHTLGGKQYFGEMHIVHVNDQFNMSITDALGKPTGLAVLGFFVTADAEKDNAGFAGIMDKLSEVPKKDDKTEIDAFPIGDLMPDSIENFFRYNGSLTTPPCSEHVTWTMFDSIISISPAQADKLKSFNQINNNFRPVQKLNTRVVNKNFEGNGGNSAVGQMSLAAMLVMRECKRSMEFLSQSSRPPSSSSASSLMLYVYQQQNFLKTFLEVCLKGETKMSTSLAVLRCLNSRAPGSAQFARMMCFLMSDN